MGRRGAKYRFSEAHVAEELKITIALALKKLSITDEQKGMI